MLPTMKASLFLMVICVANVFEQCVGFNYYWQTYPDTQGVVDFSQISPLGIWQPNCDKSKESEEGTSSVSSSSESSSESSSKESEEGSISESSSSDSSSESISEESKESKEGSSSSEESKSSSEEVEGSSSEEEKKGKKKEKREEKGKGSEEKKEAPKKKKSKESHSLFPPRTYTFPAKTLQQIVYSPPSSYNYMPYRSSYVLQPQVASYPVKINSNYQYLSLPTSASVLSGYSAPGVSRVIKNPMAKIVYPRPPVNYPSVSNAVITPGAQVYSVPASWGSSVSYVKK